MRSIAKLTLLLLCLFNGSAVCLAEPLNLSLAKKQVIEYHDSGLYQRELAQVIDEARQYILQQAKVNQGKERLALVLDIDETSISNYNKIVEQDFTSHREQINQQILAANAPAIEPMLALYNDARKEGIHVFFVTGRNEAQREATLINLQRAGYKDWSGLYVRPENYNESSIVPFKSQTRAKIAEQGYRIVASIGDQMSDIQGGYAQKGFKLPNPFYYLP